jgi:hypothetical protein
MSDVRQQVEAFLAVHDPATEERLEFLRARFDAGLAADQIAFGTAGAHRSSLAGLVDLNRAQPR